MFSAIRRRLHVSPATVIASLALVFAMTGGAYAAGRYVITSAKQIKPSVLAQLKGKAGTQGSAGAQGPVGPTGATGPQGAAGAKGETGTIGPEGPSGKNGENGKNGTTGFTKVLPSGETETGAWSIILAEGQEGYIPISFNIPLSQELGGAQVFVAPNKECPGTVEEPKAEPGTLCVYKGSSFNLEIKSIQKPYPEPPPGLGTGKGAGRSGAALYVGGAGEPSGASGAGTWAVTAE